jgi:hypothetical protein
MADNSDAFLWNSTAKLHFCRFCAHLRNLVGELTCDAFPEGIPKELISGPIFHNEPMFRQKNNIIFKPKYN